MFPEDDHLRSSEFRYRVTHIREATPVVPEEVEMPNSITRLLALIRWFVPIPQAVRVTLLFFLLTAIAAGQNDLDPLNSSRATNLSERAHLVMLVTDNEDQLMLSTFPAAGDKDQTITHRTVVSKKNRAWFSYFRAVGVFGGHLIALKRQHQLIAIDLSNGVTRQVAKQYCLNAIIAGKNLFFVAASGLDKDGKPTYAVSTLDMETGKRREVCAIAAASSGMQSYNPDFSMAVSPDETQIAVTEMVANDDDFSMIRKCRLILIDVANGRVSRSKLDFTGRFHFTGGGSQLLAPKLIWADNESLLVASEKTGSASEGYTGFSPPLDLFRFAVETQTTELVCPLPDFRAQAHDPWFSRQANGELVIHLGLLGPFLIDQKEKALVECDRAIGDYRLERVNSLLTLRHGDKVLTHDTANSRVFASSDQQRIAWLPPGTLRNRVRRDPVELKIYDRIRGVRSVTTRRFPWLYSGVQSHATNVCLWLRDKDLKRTNGFDDLNIVKDVLRPKRIDTRPVAKDAIRLKVTTDKAEYLLHQPVELTVEIVNLTKTPIRFESRLMVQGAQPFNDLYLASSESSRQILMFERNVREPSGEFVEIPAGGSRQFVRTVETGDIGEHEFRMRFRHNSKWSGYATATARFEVKEGGNQPDRIRRKFDRMLTLCAAEYRKTPSNVRSARFEQLGTAGAPLMVEYLQGCDDGEFRKRLGRGLWMIADESTLPYMKQLLKTDLQYDGTTLVNTLWSIYRRGNYQERPVPETTKLLMQAARHQRVEVRRESIRLLRGSVNDAVDQFMQEAAEDADRVVSEIAGRYVAARQQLPLHEWLLGASHRVTPANLAAARSIVRELEQQWKTKHGILPAGTYAEVTADSEKFAVYSTTLKEWVRWCFAHQRSFEGFFKEDLEPTVWWLGRAINRYASGADTPIKLNPRSTHVINQK